MLLLEFLQLFRLFSSSHFSLELSITHPLSEPELMLVMSQQRGRGCEVRSIWHTHMLFLAGPHKVMLNSIRHYERLTMLRGPHLTSAPVKLCSVLHSVGIDSYSVRGLMKRFFFFLMKPAPLMKTNWISLMPPSIREPLPGLNLNHSFSFITESGVVEAA